MAEAFVNRMDADGGTNIAPGVVAALKAQDDPERLRLVVFNTDGLVDNEALILDTIQKQRDRARMFTFGIGNSVNRYLIDQMALEGKGDVEYVTLADAADSAVNRFIARTRTPILTDISASFQGVEVQNALPSAIPDVFSEKPVIITGRYMAPGKGTVTLTGKLGNKPWSKTLTLDFPAVANAPALESLWARQRVDELTRRNYLAKAYPKAHRMTNDDIARVALEFGIMSEFTSLVAVEKRVVNIGGKQRTVAVPVEMADGMSYDQVRAEGLPLLLNSQTSSGSTTGTNTGTTTGGNGSMQKARSSYGATVIAGSKRGAFARRSTRVTAPMGLMDSISRESKMSPEDSRKFRYTTRVEKKLRESKGNVEVEVWLAKLDPDVIDKLKKLGLKVDFSDKSLKVVMGTCDAKMLIELAQVAEVDRIRKL